MNLLTRVTHKRQAARQDAQDSSTDGEQLTLLAHQRREAEIKVILYQLDEQMRTFRPMIERVLSGIHQESGLDVVRPGGVSYGFDDRYFPTYEWTIRTRKTRTDYDPDPRRVTLQLRASLGRDLSVIVVYYLLAFVDGTGDEHPLHQQPTDIKNQKLITKLLWEGIRGAGLV